MFGIWIVIGVIGGLVAGAVIGYLAASARAAARRETAAAQVGAARRREAENAELREHARRDADVIGALGPLREQLHQVEAYVARLERDRTDQYGRLEEQLRGAAATDRELRTQTSQLAGALRTTSARGQWGEMELRRVLELSGLTPHIDFEEQERLPGGRPDAVVHLPGGKSIVIDAKVPMASYLRAMSAPDVGGPGWEAADSRVDGSVGGPVSDAGRPGWAETTSPAGPTGAHAAQPGPGERARLLAEHARDVRRHVDELAGRDYPAKLEASPEFTVMFIPTEALLGEALRADPTLLDYALGKGVALATPSTLLALLKTIATIWRQATVTDQARELLELGRTLYQRLGKLGEHVGRLGSDLGKAVASYNRMVGSLERRVFAAARRFDGFDASGLEAPALPAEAGQVQALTAQDWTDRPD
ncbi:MAG: DNA recombination protein RmuC [Bifidobacteriaceae bacterium]|jgi:DNA recombination protein RmuC|nr:DNA recombination protein RmuC [Bifidobacteriaceae bacterium]